jgi:hypothetical protein
MGINRVIDLGTVEGPAKPSRVPLAEGTWLAEAAKFSFVEANSGNVGIEVVYKVTDDEAVNEDGEPFKGRVWDTMWFSEKSLKMTKGKLQGLGVDVDSVVVTSDEDLKDFVADLKDNFVGAEVKVVTEVEESEYQGKERRKARVKFINSIDD